MRPELILDPGAESWIRPPRALPVAPGWGENLFRRPLLPEPDGTGLSCPYTLEAQACRGEALSGQIPRGTQSPAGVGEALAWRRSFTPKVLKRGGTHSSWVLLPPQ